MTIQDNEAMIERILWCAVCWATGVMFAALSLWVFCLHEFMTGAFELAVATLFFALAIQIPGLPKPRRR